MSARLNVTLEMQHGFDHANADFNDKCHNGLVARAWRYGEYLKNTGKPRPTLAVYDYAQDDFLLDEAGLK